MPDPSAVLGKISIAKTPLKFGCPFIILSMSTFVSAFDGCNVDIYLMHINVNGGTEIKTRVQIPP
jgi:hypothetical protein